MTEVKREQKRRSLRGCLIWLAVPVALMIALAAVYVSNNRPPNITIPTPQMPNPNGWDDFIRASEISGKVRHWGPLSQTRPVESWTIPEYEAFISDNATALQALREGLSKPYLHPQVRGLPSGLSHYGRFRELARTLRGEAQYYEVIGKPGRAMDSRLDCLEFGVTLPRGAALIGGLVGSAIEAIGTYRIGALLSKIAPDDLERAAARLQGIQKKRVTFGDIMREQGYVSVSETVEMAEKSGLSEFLGNCFDGAYPNTELLWHDARFLMANKGAIMRDNLAYHEAVAKEQSGPYTGKSTVRPPKNCVADLGGVGRKFVVRARGSLAKKEATLTLIQVEVALRRCKAEHGGYPKRLGELKPDYLAEVPADPFGGKQLGYRALKGGAEFVLYSIGPNLRDDGGKSFKWSGESTPGDIVLQQ